MRMRTLLRLDWPLESLNRSGYIPEKHGASSPCEGEIMAEAIMITPSKLQN